MENDALENDTSDPVVNANASPASELERLKKELEKALADHAAAGGKIDQLKNQVSELGKAVAEIDQKVKAWEKASVAIKEQQKTQKTFFDREQKELEATLPAADQEFVKKTRAEGYANIKTLKSKLEAAEKDLDDKKRALAAAESSKIAAVDAYKANVDLAAKDGEWLKDIATLHGEADKEEAKNNVSRQYFLILEGEDVLARLDVPDVKAYEKRLNDSGDAVTVASGVERTAKEAVAKAQVDLQTAQKNLGDAVKNRRANSLASIPENDEAAAAVPG
jgi:chromosome segregation ATPase